MRKKIRAAILGLGIAGTSVLMTGGTASSHGYTDNPPSRQILCAQGKVKNCGQIQWEPMSVEGPKGFPSRGPADGKICAGADARWSPLDDPRGGKWPATKVTSGQNISLNWRIPVPHSTTDFRYYLTKDGFDPTQQVTRANLDLTPFHTVPYNGRQPSATTSHPTTLPQRTGRHVLVSVWTINDTGNAFYACSDVEF
ncbi:lytic polysaccharide monooxygenase [Streptomyces sp. NPDC057702]|uniref:lytic polysaccharide monooxygenase auxiliary activity family 9 protein n=1 Tax=unclassified Streptomyces TaxID=2593676 RepID=UPI003685831A